MIPIKAIILNLLSVGAAYGVLVLVFQKGCGESLLGFKSTGAIEPWLPLFLFVILFGLSMDYHVFIISRIREAVDRGMSTDDAVAHGIKTTASTVSQRRDRHGRRVRDLRDPLVDRSSSRSASASRSRSSSTRRSSAAILLPASMKLLGERNWYLPKKLGWLPKLHHEPEVVPAAA